MRVGRQVLGPEHVSRLFGKHHPGSRHPQGWLCDELVNAILDVFQYSAIIQLWEDAETSNDSLDSQLKVLIINSLVYQATEDRKFGESRRALEMKVSR